MPTATAPIGSPLDASQRRIIRSAPPVSKVRLSGKNVTDHTGSPGPTSVCASVRVLRSMAVQSVLVANGVSAANLNVVGYGETRLVSARAAKDQPGAEQNRRVVFVIETMGSPITAALLYDR